MDDVRTFISKCLEQLTEIVLDNSNIANYGTEMKRDIGSSCCKTRYTRIHFEYRKALDSLQNKKVEMTQKLAVSYQNLFAR